MRPNFLLAPLVLLAFSAALSAQAGLNGKVMGEDGPLAFANVLLLGLQDSSLVAGEMSAEDGSFHLSTGKAGEFWLCTTILGYGTDYRKVSVEREQQLDLGEIRLIAESHDLEGVTISARKPLYEQQIDRLVVNVEKAITSAGGSALEVLENSPGVLVDRQNNSISLAGKDGVQVMINGKLKYVPASALIQMLQGMGANNIEKIEIITTPPSNLDAEGNAGYINVVLKRRTDEGANGSYSFSAGVGKGSLANANTSVNMRKGNFSLFGEYSYVYDTQEERFEFYRSLESGGIVNSLHSESRRIPLESNHNGRLGFDWQAGKRTTLGGMFSAYRNRWSLDARGASEIGNNDVIDTLLTIQTDLRSTWSHASGNLNLFQDLGHNASLSLDADYLYYREINPADYASRYSDGQGNFLAEQLFRTGKETPIHTRVVKADFTKRLKSNLLLEVGGKLVRSDFRNDLSVENQVAGEWVADPELSGIFDLEESISAAYATASAGLGKKTSLKAGFRYEHTKSHLSSATEPDLLRRDFGNWFPSLFLSHQLNAKQSLNFSYSRRIRRPTFNDMAPFVLFVDPFTFWSGNSSLLPAITDNLSAGYRLNSIFFQVQWSNEKNSIMRYQGSFNANTNRMVLVTQNLTNLRTLNASVTLPVRVNRHWEMQNSLQVNQQETLFDFEGENIQVSQFNYSLNTTQRFTFSKGFAAELSGQYRSRQLRGQFVSLPYYGLNLGVQKQFGASGGTLRFGISDVFDTFVFRSKNNLGEQGIVMDGDWDFIQRTFRLTYTRNFGSQQVKAARKRTESEERSRVEGGQ